ncbi:LLM class flavin-dependent oxidoreductase [Actinophytocola oryzae]|uniref:Putative F420-dependent oxidoreductase n=1 Tax=Actinophytocola oryzae TaxID=502181 RepID=A0A4R7W1B8_9PSEU|nr:LLM class flavin-dependent oxidoreductase [Actinophytocola oryzae]TDV56350.1 putative F420-dependent oxidoreductase [Actinophytocola oryzae]
MAREFGVTLQSGADPASFARLAEDAGFDYLACGEHLAFHGPTTNAFVSLAFAAAATSRIKLVSAVTLLPLYQPVVAAKLAASLDVVSGERFTLGVGVGGEYPGEFEAAGVPVGQRGARTDEALDVVDRLLTGADSYSGPFTTFSGVTIAPRPSRRTPFWIAGRRPAALRRAARWGDAWLPYLRTPEQVAAGRAEIDAYARADGGPRWSGRTALFAFATVDRDGDRARAMAAERVGRTYQQDFAAFADKYLVAGTPGECVARLREYLAVGVDVVIFRIACPRREADTMLRLIADEVLPELR